MGGARAMGTVLTLYKIVITLQEELCVYIIKLYGSNFPFL